MRAMSFTSILRNIIKCHLYRTRYGNTAVVLDRKRRIRVILKILRFWKMSSLFFNTILKIPIDVFRRRLSRFSLSQLKDLVRDINEMKWTMRGKITDEQVAEIERKHSAAVYYISQLVNLKNQGNLKDYTDWTKKTNFKKKVY